MTQHTPAPRARGAARAPSSLIARVCAALALISLISLTAPAALAKRARTSKKPSSSRAPSSAHSSAPSSTSSASSSSASSSASGAVEQIGLLAPLDPSQEPSLGWLDSPWPPALDASPTFVRASRLTSARGRLKTTGYPCMFQGELRDDTCVSFNWGSSGFIKNPIALQTTERYKTREHSNPNLARNWAMPEMVEAITMAVDAVHAAYPDTKRLVIGDLSRREGGHFPPHLSHQSGRDADIGYYIRGTFQPEHLQKIGPHQLDVERTWLFLRSMLKNDQAQMIFMDYRLQKPLFYYMRDVAKVPPHLLRRYISYPRRNGGVIRHLKGHADHLHIRFYAPYSIAGGEAYIKKHGTAVLKPIPIYHSIRRGDNLLKIAKRYRVTWRKIMQWNRLNRRTARRLRVGQRIMVGYRTPKLP